ncbi:MAG: peptidylprolyl isomerase [Phycisphaerales bacterium]
MTIRLVALMAACLTALITLATPAALAQDESAKAEETPRFMYAKINTNMGDIVIQLDSMRAPITVENFVTYVKDGFYDGTIIHRVVPNFVIQGGGFEPGLNQKATRRPIKNEWMNGLKNDRGTLSMARTGDPNSATSQFFINLVDNANLDRAISGGAGYAVFAQVVEGMEVVDEMAKVSTGNAPNGMQNVPNNDIIMTKVQMIEESDVDASALADAMKRSKAYDEKIDAQRKQREEAAKAQQAGAEAKVKELGGDPDNMTRTDSGLLYFDLAEGDGPTPPGPTSVVRVHYSGWLTDGTKFDSSLDHDPPAPAEFPLNRVIKGWTEGVGSMKTGGKRILVIPADLAWGAQGRPGIPPNSAVVFVVELLEVVQ